MKRKSRFNILQLLFVPLFFCGLFLFSQRASSDELNSDLDFDISTDKEAYLKDDKILLDISMKNTSSKEVIFFWCDDLTKLSDASSFSSFGPLLEGTVCNSSAPKTETIHIKPGETVEKKNTVDASFDTNDYLLTIHYKFPQVTLDFETIPDQVIFNHDQNIFGHLNIVEPKAVSDKTQPALPDKK